MKGVTGVLVVVMVEVAGDGGADERSGKTEQTAGREGGQIYCRGQEGRRRAKRVLPGWG